MLQISEIHFIWTSREINWHIFQLASTRVPIQSCLECSIATIHVLEGKSICFQKGRGLMKMLNWKLRSREHSLEVMAVNT